MKPLNEDNSSCDPISSNCVIWQGNDIPCIKLCKGDSVSDVVYKLATEFCTLLDTFNISNYNISCFNLTTCTPKDFEGLIQFLIKRICAISECAGLTFECNTCTSVNGSSTQKSKSGTQSGSGCPNCMVAIAPCFYYQNPFGDTVTSMQLIDYVNAIGNRICDLASTITTMQTQITNLNNRVTILENTPPPTFNLPTLTPQCVLPPSRQSMIDVLTAVEAQFCNLQGAVGTPISVYQNIVKQCSGLNTELQLSGSGGTMASLPGWSSTVNSMAQSFGNMWLTICDMRNAIKNIQLNCCPTGCSGIHMTLTALITGDILTIYVNGTIPPGFLQCNVLGTQILVTDELGNSSTFFFDLLAYLNNPTGYDLALTGTPINISTDITIIIEPCLNNSSTNATCVSYLTYTIDNSALCPVISFTQTETTISYSFTSNLGDYSYNMQVWNSTGSVMIINQVTVQAGVATVSGIFTGLIAGTTYKIRLVILPTGCEDCDPTTCGFNIITTTPLPCDPPNTVNASINIIILG